MVRNGEIERIIQNDGDGSRIDKSYDWDNAQPWSQQTTTIDWQGFVKSIETLNDNLTKIFKEYDPNNTKPWASQTTMRDALNRVVTVETVNHNGTKILDEYNYDIIQLWSQRTTTFDALGRMVSQEEQLAGGATLKTTWSNFDENGNPTGEPVREIKFPTVSITGEMIGTIFGSSLGQIIAGDNVFAQVAANTGLSALLSNIGQTFDRYFDDTNPGGSITLDQAADFAFSDFGLNVAAAFKNQAVGAISSFLTGELSEAFGFDSQSFGDQLLRATSGILINTVVANVANTLPLWTNIAGGANPVTGVLSFVGSYLAREIVEPTTLGGAIGGSLGGQLGVLGAATLIGSIGTEVIASLALTEALGAAASVILGVVLPVGGTILGALIGTLIGTFLGDIFGGLFGQPEAHWGGGGATLTPGQQNFTAVQAVGNYGDVVNGMIVPLQNATTEVLNAYLDAIGGKVVADVELGVGFHATSDGPSQTMSVSAMTLAGATAVNSVAYEVSPGGTTARHSIDFTVIHALKDLHVAGGNLYIKRAIANSTATTLQQLSGEIKIAEDYGRYLANKDIIDALIVLNPDSAFAAGWIVTLLRAEELGVTGLNRADFYGGLVPFLQSFDLGRFGASQADVSVALEGNKLVISIAQGPGHESRRIEIDNYAQMTGLNYLVASATGAPVNGGNGDDLWIAAAGVNSTFSDVSQHLDTLSNDVLVGGSGNDTINAGVGADLIYGGAGNDNINAGTGDDVVTGGTGNDAIQGGAGDDVFVFNRGDGSDTISDIGVVIARVVLNPEFDSEEQGEEPEGEEEPLFVPYNSPIPLGTVISGGSDALQFGRDIIVEDLIVRFVGANLVIAIKDPAHPEWGFDQLTDKIQLTNWLDTKDRVETFQFADGTVLYAADIALLADVPASVVTLLDVTWDAYGLSSTTNARIVVATDGNETIAASDGVDIIYANGGDDTVSGGTGDDLLAGFGGNDLLDGGTGADIAMGGIGNDAYVVDNAGDAVMENAGEGIDAVQTSLGSYVLAANVENLVGTAATGQVLTGNALDNNIAGGAGVDTAVFSGNRADYAVSYNAATHAITLTDQRAGAPDGADTLVDIEFMQFADGTIAEALINRPPTDANLTGNTVAENAANGTVVGTVTGVDVDAGATLSYSLTDDAGGRFAINGGTGQLTVANGSLLDFESVTSHAITVRVTDQAGLSFDKTFTVNLSNVNEAGEATLSGGSVAENAANGTPVGTVDGAVPGASGALSYSLINNAGGRFAVNATTGLLTVANGSLFDYESAASHAIVVRVTDQAGLTHDTGFTINVTNVNEAPTNATLSGNTVAEGAANGTAVGTVTGADPDAGGTLSYSLTNNAGGRFAINAVTGQLTVTNASLLNYESATSHAITVRVTDQGGLTYDKAFTINVTNVNGVSLTGTAGNETLTGTGEGDTLSGLGGNDTLTGLAGSDLLYGGAGNDTYAFNRGDGADTLHDEYRHMVETSVYVADGYWDYGYSGSWWVDTSYWTTVTVEHHDDGGSDVLAFGSGIAASDIALVVSGSDLIVGVRDPANPTATFAQLTDKITLQAWTDPLDRIETLRLGGVDRTLAVGTAGHDALNGSAGHDWIAGLEGNDSIQGNAANDVLNGGTGSDTAVFSGNRANYAVSYDPATQTITLTDQRTGAPDGVDTLVDVEFAQFADGTVSAAALINNAPTDASLAGNTVAENAANGTVVGTVTGVDPDAGATLSYSLANDADGRFAINATTGQLTVANGSLLDYESATSHAVTVRVTDQYGLTFDKTFTISVANLNGVALTGSDSGNDTLTGTGEADTLSGLGGDDTLYGLGGDDVLIGGAGNDTIYTDPRDIVVFSGNFSDYAFSPSIVDGWTGNFTFTIADQRLGAPDGADTIHANGRVQWQFADGLGGRILLYDPPDLTLSANSIVENSANGTVIGSVAPTVPAAGAILTYVLVDNAGGRFAINATTGQLTVANGSLFDYESATSHGITTRVIHESGMTVEKTFTINLTNVNEAPTNATLSNNSVSEDAQIGTVVGTVTGVDPDAGATLTYSLTSNPSGSFAINAATGQLTIVNEPNEGPISITVRVTDQGGLTFDKVFGINVINSPVVLDLDGNGVDIVQLPASTARFDMNGDGRREATAWAGPADGLLTIDLGSAGLSEADGVIDQTREIVFTEWAPGTTSDMAALRRVFDTNHNDALDHDDARWSEFRIWQDRNQDGVSQVAELATLDQAGIRSIDLMPAGTAIQFADGSAITGTSAYTRTDGTTGIAGDAVLAYATDSRGGTELAGGLAHESWWNAYRASGSWMLGRSDWVSSGDSPSRPADNDALVCVFPRPESVPSGDETRERPFDETGGDGDSAMAAAGATIYSSVDRLLDEFALDRALGAQLNVTLQESLGRDGPSIGARNTGIAQLVQAMAVYSAGNSGFESNAAPHAMNDPMPQPAIAGAWHA